MSCLQVEICVHCWRYSRLLCYQLSSLQRHAPISLALTMTVFFAAEDEMTVRMLDWFVRPLERVGVKLNPWLLAKDQLLRRCNGRHQAALATQADWIWMTDADYVFGEMCLDSLSSALQNVAGPLAYPRHVLTNRTHELGDAAISRVLEPGLYDIAPTDFAPRQMPRAIGGIQIYRGATARMKGYLPNGQQGLKPVSGDSFLKCRGDVLFRRRQVRTSGTPIDLPNVYRIRHSQCGREVSGLQL